MHIVAVVMQRDWPCEQVKREVQELQRLNTQTENEEGFPWRTLAC